jgi:hypothetical protein
MRDVDQDGARCIELRRELRERAGRVQSLRDQLVGGLRILVVTHDLVAVIHREAREVGAHTAQSHNPESHICPQPVAVLAWPCCTKKLWC